MEWWQSGLIVMSVIIVILLSGLPVGFGLGLVGTLGLLVVAGPGAMIQLGIIAWHHTTSFTFIMVPFFVFMSEIISHAGIADDLYTAFHKWLSRLPAALPIASIAACAAFGAMCGASSATAVAVGRPALAEMRKRSVNMRFAVGAVAAGGTLGIIIPPSIPMILYGVAAEESIGALFLGGIIPGVILAGLLMLYLMVKVVFNPSLAPAPAHVSWKDRFTALARVWPAAILIFAVLGTIYTGIATPTEAAGVGAAIALGIAGARGRLTLSTIAQSSKDSLIITAFLLFIVIGAMTFGYLLGMLNVTGGLGNYLLGLGLSPLATVVAFQVMYLLMGCFLDPAAMIMLTIPIFAPILRNLGIDLVWFGVAMTINMEIANITPPVGVNLFIIKGIVPEDMTFGTIVGGTFPFIFVLLSGLILIIAFPQLVLWIPTITGL